jgi:hypothetical protein
MFTLAGFAESIDAAAAWANITALTDQTLRTAGDDLYVPAGLNNILFIGAGVASGSLGIARLSSPSLRGFSRPIIAPVNGNADADAEPEIVPAYLDFRQNPIPLLAQEILNAEVNSDSSAAALQWVLCGFAAGKPEPIDGKIIPVRATGTTTLTVDVWTYVPLTFDEDLGAGHYQVVGARFVSAGAVAGRLVLVGNTLRPGCLACDADDDLDWPAQRSGGLGVWAEFDDCDLPNCEFLSCSADTAECVYLDLIRTGDRQSAPMP